MSGTGGRVSGYSGDDVTPDFPGGDGFGDPDPASPPSTEPDPPTNAAGGHVAVPDDDDLVSGLADEEDDSDKVLVRFKTSSWTTKRGDEKLVDPETADDLVANGHADYV